jgi:hypothetical protein
MIKFGVKVKTINILGWKKYAFVDLVLLIN